MRCLQCGHDFAGRFGDACPACGQIVAGPHAGEAPPADPWATPQAQVEQEPVAYEEGGRGIPWEEEQSRESMFETIKLVMLETSDTFAGAKPNLSLNQAFIYALILGTIGGIIGNLWYFLIPSEPTELPEQMRFIGMFLNPGVMTLVMVPIQVAIGLFIGSAIVHVILMMLGAADGGFEATFRSIAYATGSAAPLQIIPVLGPLVAWVWALVVEILALQQMHRTTGMNAAIAVLGPLGLCCCCIGVAVAIGGLGAMSQLGS